MTQIRTIIKRNQPALLRGIPRLIARIPPDHRKVNYLREQLYRIGAGYSGECNVDSYIERSRFPKSTKIFTDVHLRISPKFTFQIDTLIITERYVLIVEVKNIKGTIRFVQNPPHLEQVLETGHEAVIDCPVYQIESNKLNLDEWFFQRGINLKTIGLVVLANPNTKVKDVPQDFPIIYKKQIPFYLQSLRRSEPVLSPAQINEISRKIAIEQQEFNPFPLCSYFNIDHQDLRTGFVCHYCNQLLQRKSSRTWCCQSCEKDVKNPYESGISDWFMLVKNSLTNEECRKFLDLKDSNAARYVLSTSLLVKKGKSTRTFYILGNTKTHH